MTRRPDANTAASRAAAGGITLLYVPVLLMIVEISFRTFEPHFLSLKKRHPGTPA